MDIKITTSDNGGKFKTPVVEINTRDLERPMSFSYASLWQDSYGIQVNREDMKDKLLDICFKIDDAVRELYDLINKTEE